MTRLLSCLTCLALALSLQHCASPAANVPAQPVDSNLANHPSWSYAATIYEVNLRQYTTEGNFTAFEKALPRLKDMGVEILWFMPINPIGLEGRKNKPSDLGSYYSVKDYYGVNPEYGNMQQWQDLVKEAHDMGFKVILDWVPNHSSPDNPWITKHPDFYKKDSTGKPLIPFDWTDTRQLNYSNPEMRDSMIAAMKFWIQQSDIDGFRCDVAWNVSDSFWKQAIPELRKMKTLFMLAEGEKPSLHDDGFDATYPWSVMNIAYGLYSGKTSVRQLDSVVDHNDSVYPKNAFRMYFTTNHDENSWNGTEFERFGSAYKTFAVWAFTMGKSIPLIYSGQEEPNRKRLQFFVHDPIAWGKYELVPFYKQLIALRKSTPALQSDAAFSRLATGKDSAVYAYLREKNTRKALVLINFSGQAQQFSIADNRIAGTAKNVFAGTHEPLSTSTVFSLQPWAYAVYDYLPQ